MKILHADDHSMFREGLRFFLKLLDPQVVVLEASNIQAALDTHPDFKAMSTAPDGTI